MTGQAMTAETRPQSQPCLRVWGLGHAYGKLPALNRIDLEVAGPGITGVLGPNGSGKSTLLNLTAGVFRPRSGGVLLDGVAALDQAQTSPTPIGHLPEHAPLHGDMPVDEYLLYAARLRGLSLAQARRRFTEVSQDLDLEPVANQEISTLSKGYRQRVGIAQALIHSPRFLFLDEPTSGLDPLIRDKVRHCLLRAASEALVMVSSHSFHEMQGLASQVCILVDGRIAAPLVAMATVPCLETLYRESLFRAMTTAPTSP